VVIRVAVGRADVAREIRAAAPLIADLASPVTARGPWLTAVLNALSAPLYAPDRPRAVVIEHPQGRRDGLALLSSRRRGPATAVTLLGNAARPVPGGRPSSRLYARDDDAASRLADALSDFLHRLRGPWTLRLGGLPMGDPTLGRLAAALPTASIANSRSRRLVDELDGVPGVVRSTDAAEVERRLPALLSRVPAADRPFARAAVRLHAAIGALEVAVVPAAGASGAGEIAAGLVTLLDTGGPGHPGRWPWWGWSEVGGLRSELGSPVVALTASAGLWRTGHRAPVR
jgi:hypothetical protein